MAITINKPLKIFSSLKLRIQIKPSMWKAKLKRLIFGNAQLKDC